MTVKRRGCLIIIAIAVLLLLPVTAIFSLSSWLPALAGYWLPDGLSLQTGGRVRFQARALTLPSVTLAASGCRIVTVTGFSAGYQHSLWQLKARDVQIDSDCLARIPAGSGSNSPAKTVAQWQAMLPQGNVRVDNLRILPWPEYAGSLSLTSHGLQQSLTYTGNNLYLQAELNRQQLQIKRLQLAAPGLPQPVVLQGKLQLAADAALWPDNGQLTGNATVSGMPLTLALNWQQQQGVFSIISPENSEPLAELPWIVTPQTIEIRQGKWQWPFGTQPVKGGISLKAGNRQDGFEQSEISGRINVLTSGRGGKGNVVLSLGPGRLSLSDSLLPLRLTGNANSADLQFYASLPAELRGPVMQPQVHFLSGALLRMRGELLDTLQVDEARWPLAGVSMSAEGISGPLQAILQVHNRDYGQYRLQLAGKASDFWPDKGTWNWRYWGRGNLRPLRASWDLKGTGHWSGPEITLETLSTGLDQIRYGQVTAVSPRLELTAPLVWLRQGGSGKFSGAFLLTSRRTRFGYGGNLPAVRLPFSVSGSSPDNFIYNAQLSAGNIGPLRIGGRWDGERLRGQAWWPSQPLTVFQPLISPEVKMKITSGDMRAQAAFSVSAREGLQAGGHWVIRNGQAWTPDNQISGAGFSLPFRYRQQRWHFGYHEPVKLSIARIDNQIGLANITASLQGYYPWDARSPLSLHDVSVDVLGGKLSLASLRLPQQQPAVLKASAISLSRLITALHPKQIAMSGYVNGEFPIMFSDPHTLISRGWVSNDGPLTLRVDKDMIDSITSNNMAAGVAVDWLRYMEISRAAATLRLDSNGELYMKSTVHGTSRFSNHDQRINLNYNHQENLFSLWQSLNFGSNLQSLLSQQLKYPGREGAVHEKR